MAGKLYIFIVYPKKGKKNCHCGSIFLKVTPFYIIYRLRVSSTKNENSAIITQPHVVPNM